MGVLYLARDPLLRRTLAIKVLAVDDDDLRERFAREARSAASLSHTNIVTIFDVGEDNGHPFLAMEYLDGETMAEMIRRKAPVALQRRLQLLLELCAGLGYAHRLGIIHRDIKPANLMITGNGTLKILDFGLARLTHDNASGLTQSGALLGTPHYMSPEQIEGRPVDHRSDIFSVGLVLYELLTYRKAYSGEGMHVVLHKITHERPQPLRELDPAIDPSLERIVDKATEREPDRRYQSLELMSADTTAFLKALAGRPDADATVIIRRDQRPEGTPRKSDAGSGGGVRTPSATPRVPNFEGIARRREAQIQLHIDEASRHFGEGRYEQAIEQCELAAVLNPEEPRVFDLLSRAHGALEEQQIAGWLSEARARIAEGSLTHAEQLIQQSLERRPAHPDAEALRREVQQARHQQEQIRERARAVANAIERARAHLANGAFDAAARAAAEALAFDPHHAEAQSIKGQALDALDAQRREIEHEQRASSAAAAARRAALAGDLDGAAALLDAFAPPHGIVNAARAEIQARIDARQRALEEAAAEKAAARAAIEIGDWAAADAALQRAAAAVPKDAEIRDLRGTLDSRRTEAEAEERRRAALRQQVADAERLLAAGDLTASVRAADAALELDADDAAARSIRERVVAAIDERRHAEEARAREQAEREARERADREQRAREEAERAERAQQEADRREREEAERRAHKEAEERAREQAERDAREQADREARLKAEREARERAEREQRAREESERAQRAREEADRLARAEAERLAREDAERRSREEAQRLAREEAERQAAAFLLHPDDETRPAGEPTSPINMALEAARQEALQRAAAHEAERRAIESTRSSASAAATRTTAPLPAQRARTLPTRWVALVLIVGVIAAVAALMVLGRNRTGGAAPKATTTGAPPTKSAADILREVQRLSADGHRDRALQTAIDGYHDTHDQVLAEFVSSARAAAAKSASDAAREASGTDAAKRPEYTDAAAKVREAGALTAIEDAPRAIALYGEAEKTYRAAVTASSNDPSVFVRRATEAYRNGAVDRAIEYALTARRLDPAHAAGDGIIESIRREAARDVARARAAAVAAGAAGTDDFAKAEKRAKDASRTTSPDDLLAQVTAGKEAAQLYRSAATAAETARNERHATAERHAEQARVLISQKRFDDADAALAQATSAEPQNATAQALKRQLSDARRAADRDARIASLLEQSRGVDARQAVPLLQQASALDSSRDDVKRELQRRTDELNARAAVPSGTAATPPAANTSAATRDSSASARGGHQADVAAILNVLERYRAAWEARDVDAIHAVYPGVNAKTLRDSFKNVRSQPMTLQAQAPDIDATGTTAVVRCHVSSHIDRKAGAAQQLDSNAVFFFSKSAAGWRIAGLEYR